MPASEHQRRADSARRDKSRIPKFSSIDEEAAFWDSHDSTEFEDEFEEVTDVQFVKAQPKKSITVRLEQDAFAALAQRAKEQGVGPSTLVRMWILEHLRQPEKTPP